MPELEDQLDPVDLAEQPEAKDDYRESFDISDITRRLNEIEKRIDDYIPQEEWFAPTLLNSWINYGGDFEVAGYMKDNHGFVHLKGVVKSGTIDKAIFTLPDGYRPYKQEIFHIISNDALGRVDIKADGNVYVEVGNNTYVSLSGIIFRAKIRR